MLQERLCCQAIGRCAHSISIILDQNFSIVGEIVLLGDNILPFYQFVSGLGVQEILLHCVG